MTHQALHDQLTGLANRLQFTDQLRRALDRAREEVHAVTLLYIDCHVRRKARDARSRCGLAIAALTRAALTRAALTRAALTRAALTGAPR